VKKDILDQVFEVIEERKKGDASASYVASLFQKGVPKINDKIMEEAEELCEAGCEDDTEHLVKEASDLLFHSLVLLSHKGATLQMVKDEMSKRFGISGHDEKASRKKE
jgi:phosphoribosyl-ATP pyrophosphohydrolase